MISAAFESEEEISSSEQESKKSDDDFDGLEGTFGHNSSYFDVFDNLLRKYVTDLNIKDEEVNEALREIGAKSIFA